MEIRRITSKDLQQFLALWRTVYAEGHYFMEGPPPDERVLAMLVKAERYTLPSFVVEDWGQVVAAGEVFPANMCGFSMPRAEVIGYLGMQVHALYRGRGLGRRLMELLIQSSRSYGLEEIELEVYRSNTRAIRLYEYYGFRWKRDGEAVTLPAGTRTISQRMLRDL